MLARLFIIRGRSSWRDWDFSGVRLLALHWLRRARSDEDEPDNGADAASDTSSDRRTDVSVGTDVSSDTSASDRSDTGSTADAGTDRTDSSAPDGGNNCVGGGDAARDGVSGMLAV